jgi:rhomboid protease GluP
LNQSSQPEPPVTAADFSVATPLPVEGEAQPAGQAAKKQSRNISLRDYPATYALLGINIAVFLIMLAYSWLGPHMSGSNFLMAEFDINTLARFGGSDAALVLQGQWWRLLTAAFVHVSLLHIALNMWCLWNLGVFGEPLLGRRGLVLVYAITGVTGNMFSLAWAVAHNADALVAGASGAVFGIAGILIVLLSNRKLSLPWNELRGLRRQVIFFAVANLAIGMAPNFLPMLSSSNMARLHMDPANLPRIDNTAHIGGFVCGLALGLPLFPRMMSGRQSYRHRQTVTFIVTTLILCLLGYAISAFNRA